MIVDPPADSVRSLYEARRLLIFREHGLRHGAFLSSLPVHAIQKWKKMKGRESSKPIKNLAKHPLQVWTDDAEAAREIQAAMIETEQEMRDRAARWFGSADFAEEMQTWRYTLTENEPLHTDQFAERVTGTVVRMFVNLDSEPRLWDVGDPPERVAFQPGCLWLVDSQKVPHAIIYGRRALMSAFELRAA